MKECEAREKLCPMAMNADRNNWTRKCQGKDCMAWEQDYKRETKETMETEALNRGHEVNGWFVDGCRSLDFCTAWVRYVPLDSGDCGMKSKESGCGYLG